MPPPDFDAYADTYLDAVQRSIDFSGKDHDYFTRRKAQHLLDVATRRVGDPRRLRVLDVGCGVGATDRHLVDRVGALYGVDTAAEAVRVAEVRNPLVRYETYDGRRLPFRDAKFDLAFAICVVHHVQPPDRAAFASELRRVVGPGGLVVVFEHNPLNPLTRVAVSRCELDDDAALLGPRELSRLLDAAGLRQVERRYIIFFPFERTRSKAAERHLCWFPAGAQYYVAAAR